MQPLWKRAGLWLLLLGPLFFVSYGGANWLASQRMEVGHIVFDWEQYIPFVPWTIVPYWLIDVMYALSLFVCASKQELDVHAKRLLTAQAIAVSCFILFPLGFTFERPHVDGWIGTLFNTLSAFDQPFNQAPSLHIALLVILWVRYVAHIHGWLQWLLHLLCTLIAVSVLTTYQHHFIDVPTGALLGWFCIWLWSMDEYTGSQEDEPSQLAQRTALAVRYAVTAIAFAILALLLEGWFLWLFWPSFSLLLVAVIYRWIGPCGFQKSEKGGVSLASRWLLYPYLLGTWINSRLWTLRSERYVHIDDGVWLGRFPTCRDVRKKGFAAIVDLTAEFNASCEQAEWQALPSLDLVTLSNSQLKKTAAVIEQMRRNHDGPVLVVCALGFSRSVAAMVAWLLQTGRVEDVASAIARVGEQRPALVLRRQDRKMLAEFAQTAVSNG